MSNLARIVILAVPAAFFLAPMEWAGLAPAAGAAVGLLAWSGAAERPPRLWAWLAVGVGVLVGILRISPGWLPSALCGAAALGAAELLGRKSPSAPPLAFVLLAGGALAGGWFLGGKASGGEPLLPAARIVVIGDSLAAGVGSGADRLWPEILGARLNADVVNLSKAGDTVDDAYRRWGDRAGAGRWKAGNPEWRPELIIVELGGNDIQTNRGSDAVERGLRRWVETLPSDVPVLLVAVPGSILGVSDDYKGTWWRVARDYENVHHMDRKALRSIFGNPRYTLPDRIHFSQAGHEYFAELVAERITKGG